MGLGWEGPVLLCGSGREPEGWVKGRTEGIGDGKMVRKAKTITVKLTMAEAKALDREATIGKERLVSVAAHRALCKLNLAMDQGSH